MPGKIQEVCMTVFIILSYIGLGKATVFMCCIYRYKWQIYIRRVNNEIKIGDLSVVDVITL
jgi:hypothetical protein